MKGSSICVDSSVFVVKVYFVEKQLRSLSRQSSLSW